MTAAEVTPERILKDLSALWVSLGQKEAAGVVRACAMTLIMAAEDSEDESQIGELLAGLVHDHPSRAIVIRAQLSPEAILDARVLAQCWMPFGKRQQICCEQIEIRASEASLGDVPRLVMSLLAPDLPLVLVCRSTRFFEHHAFQGLLQLANKVILDSRRAPDAPHLVQSIGARIRRGRPTADLAWTRLTPWREAVALVFDAPEMLRRLKQVQRVELAHAGEKPGVEACYLAAWIEKAIGARVDLLPHAGGGPIQAIRMFDAALIASWERRGACLRIQHNHAERKLPLTELSDRDLLREELSILGHDKVFEDAIPRAITLLGDRQ